MFQVRRYQIFSGFFLIMSNLIIGYGSLLRGDDGVAWRIIDALTVKPEAVRGEAWAVHQLAPELADPISRARLVVFIDAIYGDTPGEVQVFPLELAPPQRGSHQTTPEGLLALAEDLYGRRPPAYIVTITGQSFEIAENLSPAVTAAIPEAVNRILTLLEK